MSPGSWFRQGGDDSFQWVWIDERPAASAVWPLFFRLKEVHEIIPPVRRVEAASSYSRHEYDFTGNRIVAYSKTAPCETRCSHHGRVDDATYWRNRNFPGCSA